MKPGKAGLVSDWAIDLFLFHCRGICPDFALSRHTSAPTWVFKGLWGRGR
jgi:hypothetical protein